MTRRLKKLKVSTELILGLWSGTFRVKANELPPDMKLEEAQYDEYAKCFVCIVSHDSFSEVADGERIPFAKSAMIERL